MKCYLVVWWMERRPYAAVFTDKVTADASANVRNAVSIAIEGSRVRIDEVVDWYRRNDRGDPMPAEWRDLLGRIRLPWLVSPRAYAPTEAIAGRG